MLLINRWVVLCFIGLLTGCEPAPDELAGTAGGAALNQPGEKQALKAETSGLEESLAELEAQMGINLFSDPWTGDLDAMLDHRVIRVLTIYGTGRYYLDGGQEKGLTYEMFKNFENFINTRQKTKHLRTHVVFLPVARGQLIPGLLAGRGDIVAAGLTITPERDEIIDFSNPVSNDIAEVLVTGPTAPRIETLADLGGHRVYVRKSSSYRSSIDVLNLDLKLKGLDQIEIEDADESLEDEDLLEMVNVGLLDWAVVDDYKAGVWADVFENLTIRTDLVFRSGGRIGFGIRENSPQLAAALNDFLTSNRQGTLQGNMLVNRYLKNFDWAKNALANDDYERFQAVAGIFEKFGKQYGVDYLMVTAQGYQESRLDQNARSGAGAIGIMQLLPSTAADSNVGIPDIENVDSNIHAGVKYLDFVRKRYFSDTEVDTFNQTLFALAAYNAGPARIQKLRQQAARQGYDANVWFDNVEVMAAKDIGHETVQYVANILKYYIAYSISIKQQLEREQTRQAAGIQSGA